MGKNWNQWQIWFYWAPKFLQTVIATTKLRRLIPGRKALINLDSILKSRDVTLLTKIHIVKAMVFPVAMYGCESWTIKKVEHPRTGAFELWCWRRFLRVPWTARRSVNPKGNQPWIFIGRTGVEAEALILWPPDGKSQLIEEDPDAGKDWKVKGAEAGGGWDGSIASPTQWT